MLGTTTTALDLIGTRAEGDRENLGALAKVLAKAGFPVLLTDDLKRPLDMRTSPQSRADDEAAQEQAKANGNPAWMNVTQPRGVYLATTDTDRVDKYIKRYVKQHAEDPDELTREPNLALRVGIKHIVVDADRAEGVDWFKAMYREATGSDIEPAILTPGTLAIGGNHVDGGHFVLTLPEDYELPEKCPASINLQQGEGDDDPTLLSFLLHSRYHLIPPSVRADGPYIWRGGVAEAPADLLAMIEDRAAEAQQRAKQLDTRRAQGPNSIDTWAAGVSWASLLEPDGWAAWSMPEACGCPTFTAPGVHSSPKSAVGHENGCGSRDVTSGHGPLHLWTDNPPQGIADYQRTTGKRDLTKLTYVAWTRHKGDLGAACRALGIPSSEMSSSEQVIVTGVSRDEKVSLSPEATNDLAAARDEVIAENLLGGHEFERVKFSAARLRAVGPINPDALAMDKSASAQADSKAMTPAEVVKEFRLDDKDIYPLGFPSDHELLREIFDFSDVTRAIFHHARDQRLKHGYLARPMSLLMTEMIRRGTRAPVTLRVNGAPLSTYVARVGRPSTGKSSKSSPWPELSPPIIEGSPKTLPPQWSQYDHTEALGSGQALVDTLTEVAEEDAEGKTRQVRVMKAHPSAWVADDEMTAMLRKNRGQTATISSTLASAWIGEQLGDRTKTHGSTHTSGEYSVFYTAGVQPELSGDLLADVTLGLPQRFVFVGMTDPYAQCDSLPEIPNPGFVAAPVPTIPAWATQIKLCHEVYDAITAQQRISDYDVLPPDYDPMDGHAVLVRMKLAALAALLHGTIEVTPELWTWTGHLMEHSRRARAQVIAAIDNAAAEELRKKGRDMSYSRTAGAADHRAYVTSVAKRIMEIVGRHGPISSRGLHNSLGVKQRSVMDAAIEILMSDRLIGLDRKNRFTLYTNAETVA